MRYSRRRWSSAWDRQAAPGRKARSPPRTTDRKEKHGHCQESCEEIRSQEARREKDCCQEARCEEECSQETRRSEEVRREEARCEEIRCEAQAKRCVHEGDDALVGARRCGRWHADAADGSDEEDLGLHQEEQAAGRRQQAPDQRRRA